MSAFANTHQIDHSVSQETQKLLPVVQSFMTTALDLMSAQRGLLVKLQKGSILVEAHAYVGRANVVIDMISFEPSQDEIPMSLVEEVMRTHAPTKLDEANRSFHRRADPFLAVHPHCTVVILPLMKRDALVGMLYVESQGAGVVIAGEQMRFLELLASQAVVSLEMARLYAATADEINERRQVEKALRESQAVLLLGERINQSGSWTWDGGTRVLNCSAEFCRIYEFHPYVSAISFDALMQYIHPCDREYVIRTFEDAVEEQHTARFEHRIVARNGEIHYLAVIGQPILETDGNVYVGTVTDITSRKADEIALSKGQAELARGARLATISQMTAVIAHEVNQPLMSISSNAGAALIRLERGLLDAFKLKQLLNEIVGQSQRAGTIIQTLQALAYRCPQLETVDLHTLVDQVLQTMRGELERHQISVELDLRVRPIRLEGDSNQFQQVLANLVGNAVDALHEVQGRERILQIASRTLEGNKVEVRVEDNGTGADAATYERMFEPFVRTKPDGMGMGLAICRSIIESHGGRIQAHGRQPNGCSVIFTIAEQAETLACRETGREST